MREILITPDDLLKFMVKENYENFIQEIRNRINNHEDYDKIKDA